MHTTTEVTPRDTVDLGIRATARVFEVDANLAGTSGGAPAGLFALLHLQRACVVTQRSVALPSATVAAVSSMLMGFEDNERATARNRYV